LRTADRLYIPEKAIGYVRESADVSVWLINRMVVTSSVPRHVNHSPWLRYSKEIVFVISESVIPLK
jgi:hypothetical protein